MLATILDLPASQVFMDLALACLFVGGVLIVRDALARRGRREEAR